jgi:hypothetical protein
MVLVVFAFRSPIYGVFIVSHFEGVNEIQVNLYPIFMKKFNYNNLCHVTTLLLGSQSKLGHDKNRI